MEIKWSFPLEGHQHGPCVQLPVVLIASNNKISYSWVEHKYQLS